MRRLFAWLLALSPLVAGCASSSTPRASVLPVRDFVSVDGTRVARERALGQRATVVDLWATWCAACEKERPKLERLHRAFAKQGLSVLGVNEGEERSVVVRYLASNPISYPVYLDPDFGLSEALGDNELPAILVIDKDGRIVHRSRALDQETLDRVRELLR